MPGIPFVRRDVKNWPDALNRKPTGPLLTGSQLATLLYGSGESTKGTRMSDELENLEADLEEQILDLSEQVAAAKARGEVVPPEVEAGLAELAERLSFTEEDSDEALLDSLADRLHGRMTPQPTEEQRLDATVAQAAARAKDTRRPEDWNSWMAAKTARAQYEASKQDTSALPPTAPATGILAALTPHDNEPHSAEWAARKTAEYKQKEAARHQSWLAQGKAAFAKRDEPGNIEWGNFCRDRAGVAEEIVKEHRAQEAADRRYMEQLRALPPEPANPYGNITGSQRASG